MTRPNKSKGNLKTFSIVAICISLMLTSLALLNDTLTLKSFVLWCILLPIFIGFVSLFYEPEPKD